MKTLQNLVIESKIETAQVLPLDFSLVSTMNVIMWDEPTTMPPNARVDRPAPEEVEK